MPILVFWQLNGKRTIYPEIDEKNGIIYLSGFSTNELELVMAGKYETSAVVEDEMQLTDEGAESEKKWSWTGIQKKILTPKEQLGLKLAASRYDAIEEAVKRGLEKECS